MTTLVHFNLEGAVNGTKVLYRGATDYPSFASTEIAAASLLFVNDGATQYTINEIFDSVGNPTVSLVEFPGTTALNSPTFDASLFADVVAKVSLHGYDTLVGGTGGTSGTFNLATIPAPQTGGTQAVATFTVAGGVVTAITVTTAGIGYGAQLAAPVALTNTAFAASTGLTGASVNLDFAEIAYVSNP